MLSHVLAHQAIIAKGITLNPHQTKDYNLFTYKIFGIENARKVLPARVTRVLLAVGVLLFGGTGVVSFFFGHNFLDYNVLLKNSVSGQHLGIFLVELGVGITVSATMITIFYIFASQDK